MLSLWLWGDCWNACSLYRCRLSATNFKGLVPWHSIGVTPTESGHQTL